MPLFGFEVIVNKNVSLFFLWFCFRLTMIDFTRYYNVFYAELLKLAFVMVGKFAITAAYSTVYLYSAEIFPTAIRFENRGWVEKGGRASNFGGERWKCMQCGWGKMEGYVVWVGKDGRVCSLDGERWKGM